MAKNPYIQINPIAWLAIANNVVQLTEQTETEAATYRITVDPIDTNDSGAGLKDIAYYFKDYIGTTCKIIDYDSTTIDVEDSFRRGFCPVVGNNAIVYKSIEENSPYLAPIFYRFLSKQAEEYSRQLEQAVLYQLVNRSNGTCQITTYTDNGDGSITLDNGQYCLSSNADGSGIINMYDIEGGLKSLTDGVSNYIVANYNSGNPIIQVITDVTLINETTIVPVLTFFRRGTILHEQNWDQLGLALANKIHQSIVKTQRYRREYGLTLSEYGTRNLALTTGRIWTGAVPLTLDAIASATDTLFLFYHSSGVWTASQVTQYNNTQYDNGTNLATLTSNRYAVNWIFRGVESQKHLYIILGVGDYTISQAQDAIVPIPPIDISSHAVLVGKLIVQKSSATANSIQSAFDTNFSLAPANNHADLTNLAWGNSGHTGTINTIAIFSSSGAASYINFTVQPLSGTTVSWDANSGINATLTLSGNTTITLSNLVAGTSGNIPITNPSTLYTLTVSGYTNKISPSAYLSSNQLKVSGSSKLDIFSWYYDGTYLWWNGGQDYK